MADLPRLALHRCIHHARLAVAHVRAAQAPQRGNWRDGRDR
ncbi:hypothetical protein [Xanthomonas sp. 3058]|nr:hypothetical protein [Xanthomonas sp. 3058]MBB5863965.1 hypothetical protein [Xanthomonas sp. 3058]